MNIQHLYPVGIASKTRWKLFQRVYLFTYQQVY